MAKMQGRIVAFKKWARLRETCGFAQDSHLNPLCIFLNTRRYDYPCLEYDQAGNPVAISYYWYGYPLRDTLLPWEQAFVTMVDRNFAQGQAVPGSWAAMIVAALQ